MRKEILSISIVAMMIATPCLSFANENYTMIEPVYQEVPAINQQYQTQYPLPVNNSYQTQGFEYQAPNYNNLQGNVVMVPVNTSFEAVSMSSISSETASVGDSVSFYLGSDFYYGKNLIASAGSRVNGTIIKAKKGSWGNRNGQIQIRFTNIVTPTGQMIPISASLQTSDGSGILKAGTAKDVTKEYAKDATVGAAAGAVLGTAMGALSGGSVGRGAIYGTAVGGGMGLIQNAFEKGGNVDIPQNAQMNIVLNQPVTVSSNTPY
ncbi:MAG: hypothetical protein IJY61_03605 [Candidatus Gastranaerophilales bacterium]|nr:hypothetical protein [Candidatus Gastranaerophilales bacterium]